MNRRRRSRECALQLLYQIDLTSAPLEDTTFTYFWEERDDPDDVMAFAEELARGAYEHRFRIDRILASSAAHWNIERMAAVDRNILRLAAYEIVFRDDIPPRVSINEAVEIAKKYSTPDSPAFVNGILDRLLRETRSAGQPADERS